MTELKYAIGRVLKKELTGHGTKKDGSEWKRYRVTLRTDDVSEQELTFSIFGNTKGFELVEENKFIKIGYVKSKFTNKDGKDVWYNNIRLIKPADEPENFDVNSEKEKEFLKAFPNIFTVATKDQMEISYFVGAYLRNLLEDHPLTKIILRKYKELKNDSNQ